MPLELRSTDDRQAFDLYDGTDKVGVLAFLEPEEENDPTSGWHVEVWSLVGHINDSEYAITSVQEAVDVARSMYDEAVAKRREAEKPLSGPLRPRVISTPMGGQPRR